MLLTSPCYFLSLELLSGSVQLQGNQKCLCVLERLRLTWSLYLHGLWLHWWWIEHNLSCRLWEEERGRMKEEKIEREGRKERKRENMKEEGDKGKEREGGEGRKWEEMREGEVRVLTGMSPLSSRLSSPLRASSCDIGGGVSYSQRSEEEEERKKRIVQPWPPQLSS